jgi:hypothetical protein
MIDASPIRYITTVRESAGKHHAHQSIRVSFRLLTVLPSRRLKHEANESYPIAAGPTLPLRMRRAPRRDWPWAVAVNVWPWEVPEKIAWQAGLLSKKGSPAWRGTRLPDWHHKFCKGKHGPC